MSRAVYSEETCRKIVELHTQQKLGIKAIAKWFKGKPGKTTVERILREAGVYQGPERMAQQRRQTEDRRQRIIARERKWRHRMAVCLWNLRQGIGVETTCHQHGWKPTSIWNYLLQRSSYRRLRSRLDSVILSERIKHQKCGWVSSEYPREKGFCSEIAKQLNASNVRYFQEFNVGGTRYRADFYIRGTLLEAKVDTTHNQMKKCLGQCWLYKSLGHHHVAVIVPDDVRVDMVIKKALQLMAVDVIRLDQLPELIDRIGGR